ncbi:MAG: hypothetical protein ABIV13_03375 [Fimbriimonadales bacterium]
MRTLLTGVITLACLQVIAQETPILLQGRADIIVSVRKSDVGAEYVRIQALAEDYPVDLMRAQIQKIGDYNGTEIRGLEVNQQSIGDAGTILTATFATDRLMDQASGTLELNAFAKAFAGAPEPHTVKMVGVMFEGFKPSETVTVAQFADKFVEVSSAFDNNLQVVEYRIKLNTQNPEEISIPETIAESTNRTESPSNKGLNPWIVVGIVCGAVLIGVSVYFAMRPRASKAEGPGHER